MPYLGDMLIVCVDWLSSDLYVWLNIGGEISSYPGVSDYNECKYFVTTQLLNGVIYIEKVGDWFRYLDNPFNSR